MLIESFTSHLESIKVAKDDLEAVVIENETEALNQQSKKMVTLLAVMRRISGDAVSYLAEQTQASPELDDLLLGAFMTSCNEAFSLLADSIPDMLKQSIEIAPTDNS